MAGMDDFGGEMRRMEVPNAILLGHVKEALQIGHTATINVKGYSMRPFLENSKDKVRLAPPGVLRVGDAVLAEIARLSLSTVIASR